MDLDVLKRVTCTVHDILKSHVKDGDVAVDATCGNGNDTKLLLELVGPGSVYAIDVQESAVENTKKYDNGHLKVFLENHAKIDEIVEPEDHGRIKAVVYNLGYLPGSDKTVKTNKDDLIVSLKKALPLLADGGIILICCYSHDEGQREFAALVDFCSGLSGAYDAYLFYRLNRKDVPKLLILTKT